MRKQHAAVSEQFQLLYFAGATQTDFIAGNKTWLHSDAQCPETQFPEAFVFFGRANFFSEAINYFEKSELFFESGKFFKKTLNFEHLNAQVLSQQCSSLSMTRSPEKCIRRQKMLYVRKFNEYSTYD